MRTPRDRVCLGGLCLLALLLCSPAAEADLIDYGSGSLSLGGSGYTHAVLSQTIDLQNYTGHITGRLDLSGLNSTATNTYFEIGVLAEGQYDFWNTAKGDPEDVWAHGTDHFTAEWFNHGVYLLGMEWNYDYGDDFYWLYPQDYMSDARAATGAVQGNGIFDFDLWLEPDSDGRGGTARVSVNGGAWGPDLAYGTQKDQYGNSFEPGGGSHNWMAWNEEFSQSHLYLGLWSSESGTHTVSYDQVEVSNPEPASMFLGGLAALAGLAWRRLRAGHPRPQQ